MSKREPSKAGPHTVLQDSSDQNPTFLESAVGARPIATFTTKNDYRSQATADWQGTARTGKRVLHRRCWRTRSFRSKHPSALRVADREATAARATRYESNCLPAIGPLENRSGLVSALRTKRQGPAPLAQKTVGSSDTCQPSKPIRPRSHYSQKLQRVIVTPEENSVFASSLSSLK